MTTSDRAAFLTEKSEQLYNLMQDVTVIRDKLEENGFLTEAVRADTISSKLNILAENLANKARTIKE